MDTQEFLLLLAQFETAAHQGETSTDLASDQQRRRLALLDGFVLQHTNARKMSTVSALNWTCRQNLRDALIAIAHELGQPETNAGKIADIVGMALKVEGDPAYKVAASVPVERR